MVYCSNAIGSKFINSFSLFSAQAMINLMLTGRAAANVFNGDIECNKSGRKLVNDELHSVLYFVLVAVFDVIFV